MLNQNQIKSIIIGSGLVFLNVILMWLLTYTPIPALTLGLFKYIIVGMLVFFGLFFLGGMLIDSGIKSGNLGTAYTGVAILQLTYGAFGSSILSLFDQSIWLPAIIISAIATTFIAIICGTFVYSSNKDFSKWKNYSTYTFLAALVLGFIGTFVPAIVLLIFILTLAGFFMYLVYEIWATKVDHKHVLINGLGLYGAFMGVLLHILQIVLQMLSRSRD